MSIPIIINIEAGEKECGDCYLLDEAIGEFCVLFNGYLYPVDDEGGGHGPAMRTSACLAAEQKYKDMKDRSEGRRGYHDVSDFYCDDKEAPDEEK